MPSPPKREDGIVETPITTKRAQGIVAIGQNRLRLASRVEVSKELDLRLPSHRMTRYKAGSHINTTGHNNPNHICLHDSRNVRAWHSHCSLCPCGIKRYATRNYTRVLPGNPDRWIVLTRRYTSDAASISGCA